MKILGIDTSTKTMSIALTEDEKILGELNFYSNMDHSERLIDNIKFLMENNNMKISDLDFLGVAVGPGSFTGIRIGISTAKGICEFSNLPVVVVSSLETLSENFYGFPYVAIAVDAKRDRVYGAIYSYKNDEKEVLLEENLYSVSEFSKEIEKYKDIIISGDAKDKFKSQGLIYAKGGTLLNRASNICSIALRKYKRGEYISHLDLKANYMTKSQAQTDHEKILGN